MDLKSYLNLFALLENPPTTHEENRAFGLSHQALKQKPVKALLAWEDSYVSTLPQPSLGERFSSYLYGTTLILGVLAFILGVLSGLALLSYSGHEPVNVIYFIAMVVFFPLLTMFLTLIAMMRTKRNRSLLVHISPAFWMEKIFSLLPNQTQKDIKELKINPLLLNWIMIKRSQILALLFSLGLFIALISIVVTKDIAFAWSTTLHITPEAFHAFLNTLALPWRELFPDAVPSIELIKHSQYFRLGDSLSKTMIDNASELGEWWKFLACATFFYAIFLRFLLFLLANFGLNRAIEKSTLTLPGATKLLREMNEPIIRTHANNEESVFVPSKENYEQLVHTLDASYDMVQGWAIGKENLVVLNDSMQIITPEFFEVGGSKSLEEDNEILAKSHGEVLFFVKGWEPPTMDFIDYIKELSLKVDKIIVVPVGTAKNNYKIDTSAVDVWDRKLSQLHEPKVWLKR